MPDKDMEKEEIKRRSEQYLNGRATGKEKAMLEAWYLELGEGAADIPEERIRAMQEEILQAKAKSLKKIIMKILNKESTEIFCLLIEKLNGKQYLKIENEPFMPLVIEKIGEAYDGEALLFSLCHYYKQNGDLMQDPEVCFAFIDGRNDEHLGYEHVQVIPYSFEQANLGIYQVSITFYCGVVEHCDEQMQTDHTAFAEGWLKNIFAQNFLQA